MRLLILAMAVLAAIGAPVSASPATATELLMDLLNTDNSNIDTGLLLTICYTDGDGNPQCMDSVTNAGDGTLGTIDWSIVGGKSNMYSLVPGKDGTDIVITIDGYDPLTVIADEGGQIIGTYNLAQDEFDVVMAAAVADSKPTPFFAAVPFINAANLKIALDANDATTPLVLDMREYSEYSTSHIPGAINIHYRDLGKDSALNDLDSALLAHQSAHSNEDLVVYGNTRHLSRMVAYYLSATQGYTVKALAKGFSEWHIDAPGRFIECDTFDANGRGSKADSSPCTSNNFPTTVADAINARDISGEGYATLDNIPGAVTSADLAEVTRAAYDARFGDPSKPEYRISARELYDLLDDNGDGTIAGAGDDLTNDPFVLSNRGTTTSGGATGPYDDKGHIPTAVAVDVRDATDRLELITLDNTDFMPTDRTIVHHCWVGVSQQYGGTWYGLLGYETRSLDWGIQGWTTDTTVRNSGDIVITPLGYAYDTTPNLCCLIINKPIYGVGETVIVNWTATAAPTQPNWVMVEVYNIDDATTDKLAALDPSTTSYSYVVPANQDGDLITVYVYYADDDTDHHGDPGTSDEISTAVPYEVPEFPLPAILFGMFIPIYFTMRRHFQESMV